MAVHERKKDKGDLFIRIVREKYHTMTDEDLAKHYESITSLFKGFFGWIIGIVVPIFAFLLGIMLGIQPKSPMSQLQLYTIISVIVLLLVAIGFLVGLYMPAIKSVGRTWTPIDFQTKLFIQILDAREELGKLRNSTNEPKK